MRIPIALVYRNFNLEGSIERDHVLLARGLAARGLEVHCFGLPERRFLHVDGVIHHDVDALVVSRSRIGYALECASFARAATMQLRRRRGEFLLVDVVGTDAWEQDVVTVHGVARAGTEEWLELARGRVRFARAHSLLAPVARPRQLHARIVERLQFRSGRTLRAIARAEQVKVDLEHVHGVPPDRIDVIHPAVDVARLDRPPTGWLRARLGLTPRDGIVLFVGRLSDEKGLGDVIKALAGVDERAHLVVLGRGDVRRFEDTARDAGVEKRVHLMGFSDTPEDFYSEADAFVFPTRRDVWGMPVVEAMAAGVPVVCTDAAGAAAAVLRADAGLVVPVGPEPLRDALCALLGDEARRAALGRNGKAAARAFDLTAHVDAVLVTYAKALEERAALADREPDRQRIRSAVQALGSMLGR